METKPNGAQLEHADAETAGESATPVAETRSSFWSVWGPWLLLAFLAATYILMTRTSPLAKEWGQDFDVALARAGESNRNVLVFFTMPGCAPCAMMERSVFPASKVRKALDRLVPVYIDATKQPELARRYGAFGTPTFAIVDPKGKLLSRSVGYQPAEQFEQFLSNANP